VRAKHRFGERILYGHFSLATEATSGGSSAQFACGVFVDNILDWLPTRPQQPFVRYGTATIIVLTGCAIQFALAAYTGLPGFSLLLMAVFVCGLAFDRGTGVYGTILASISSYLVIRAWFPTASAPALAIFFFVMGTALAFLGDALRLSLERAIKAEREKALLLRELSHRTQNNLAMIAAMLHMEAGASTHPEVQNALQKASARIQVLAEANRHLERSGTTLVDLGDYVRRVCEQIQAIIRTRHTIRYNSVPIEIPVEKAVVLGLTANELITNSLKHAFSDAEGGIVSVSIARIELQRLELIVADNGAGSHNPEKGGVGTQLIDMMMHQHEGRIVRENTRPGFRVAVTMPIGRLIA
jgi:two-component sensor histidine kinase